MEKTVNVTPRKLARSMARAQMRRMKLRGVNKEPVLMGQRGESFFQREWRRFAAEAQLEAIAREKARKNRKKARA